VPFGTLPFYGMALDEEYLWAAVRYVERNPVRAKLVRCAEDYRWSSAAAHCGLRAAAVLTKKARWRRQFEGIGDWSGWLAEGDEAQALERLRCHAEKGVSCSSEKFVRKLEKVAGRTLQYRPQGRPREHDEKG